ncbi:MAG: D-alanyl-D-alanine carboxypeptidase [Oscillospiraceae bacterium]|nr:D-alanyl-D-alanine carboxypeptidase [Oscillospiraceae bacterium]
MKRIASVFLIAVIIISVFAGCSEVKTEYTYAPNFEVKSQSVYLVNMGTETLIYEQNSDKLMYPSTLTQMVTAIIAIEETQNLDEQNIVISEAIANKYEDLQVSKAMLKAGEVYSMRELVTLMLITNAQDVAEVIADNLSNGNIDAFVERMNTKVKSMGTIYTNFINPTGEHSNNQYTTVKDMYLIAKYCANMPLFIDLANQKVLEISEIEKTEETAGREEKIIASINPMLTYDKTSEYYSESIISLGMGHSQESGDTFISRYVGEDSEYMLILMGAEVSEKFATIDTKRPAIAEAIQMYDWAEESYSVITPEENQKTFAEVSVDEEFSPEKLTIISKKPLKSYLPQDLELADVALAVKTQSVITDVVTKGDMIGTAQIISNHEIVSEFPLYAQNDIKVVETKTSFEIPKGLVTFFVVVVILFALVMVIRAINIARYKKIRQQRRRKLASRGNRPSGNPKQRYRR